MHACNSLSSCLRSVTFGWRLRDARDRRAFNIHFMALRRDRRGRRYKTQRFGHNHTGDQKYLRWLPIRHRAVPLRLRTPAGQLAKDCTVGLLLRSASRNLGFFAADLAKADIAVGPCWSRGNCLAIDLRPCRVGRTREEAQHRCTTKKHYKSAPPHCTAPMKVSSQPHQTKGQFLRRQGTLPPGLQCPQLKPA